MADVTPRMTAAEYLRMTQAAGARKGGSHERQSASAASPEAPEKKLPKYRNCKTEDGYDSRKEARVHRELEMQRGASDPDQRVVEIERQRRYLVIPKQEGERATHYVADFVVTYASGRVEVIDAKSSITRKEPKYVMKRKLMLLEHGIRIKEV